MPHHGQCLCGQVTFEASSDPLGARSCWCRDCQRIASGSATVNVLFAESDVAYHGDITTLEMIADSGNRVERGFCPKCGSQMYSKTVEPAGLPMRVRAGTLDDPEICPPTSIIWARSAPSWAPLPVDQPWHEMGPDSPLIEKQG